MATVDQPANKSALLTSINRFWQLLGPGLITGASDDDPSGIGTYSQAGAQLGFGIAWTMLLTYPLMVGIQEISARLGRTTGRGIAGNLCRHYPPWLLQVIVALLFIANTFNIGADLGAMGDAARLVLGGPAILYIAAFGAFCAIGVFMRYARYVALLKWMTLSLFAYVLVLFTTTVQWSDAWRGICVPSITWTSDYFTTLVAIFGTTISPYLFFWQASQEAEDQRVNRKEKPLVKAPAQARQAFERIRLDTRVGMAFSNLVALAIIIATAATLHEKGVTDIQTSAQAAEALRPIAGEFAAVVFALGIVGTGSLAVPVLAGSAAYAVGEARRWTVGLARRPQSAMAFYAVIVIATMAGTLLNFTPLNPIKALYWSAVINGIVAVPVMIVMMSMTARVEVMGKFTVTGGLRWLGWTTTIAMGICVVVMGLTWVV
jgi:NRAMP (natural resistance-associated macrophage protein)-like metal ion transporter